jgi:hypothetical protein
MIGYLMRKIFSVNLTSELTEIKLTENGFLIIEPFGAKPKMVNWNEIKNIQFSKNYLEVIVETSEKVTILKNNNIGWYELIQSVPSNFFNFDYDYVKAFMNSLKPCGVCGIIAVRENKCIVCEIIAWNSEMPESETAYLKSKQFDFYSSYIKEGIKIKKVAEPEHGFKADKNWKLYF